MSFGGIEEAGRYVPGILEGEPVGTHIVRLEDYEEASDRRRRFRMYRYSEDFFGNVLGLEAETWNPKFLDWMVDKRGFTVHDS